MAPQRTPLYSASTRKGASFQEWYDWELPRTYSDLLSEYTAAREGVALHDASYTGRIVATGEDVLDLLNRLSTNEIVSLQPGQGAPTVLTTDRDGSSISWRCSTWGTMSSFSQAPRPGTG